MPNLLMIQTDNSSPRSPLWASPFWLPSDYQQSHAQIGGTWVASSLRSDTTEASSYADRVAQIHTRPCPAGRVPTEKFCAWR